MNISVIGAGAIGGWVAGRLALARERVSAVTSRGALTHIDLSEGGDTKRAELVTPDAPADVLIVAVKATSLAAAAQSAVEFIGPDTVIVPMLNGVPWWFVEGVQLKSIDPDGLIARSFPQSQVVGCVVHASCSRSGATVVV